MFEPNGRVQSVAPVQGSSSVPVPCRFWPVHVAAGEPPATSWSFGRRPVSVTVPPAVVIWSAARETVTVSWEVEVLLAKVKKHAIGLPTNVGELQPFDAL